MYKISAIFLFIANILHTMVWQKSAVFKKKYRKWLIFTFFSLLQ